MDEQTQGTAVEETTEAPAETQDTSTSEASATQGQTEGAAQTQDTFVGDAELLQQVRQDPRLNRFFTKMQGAYTKKMQQASEWRQHADTVQRFNTDPAYRRAILQQYAHELQAGQPTAPTASNGNGVKAPAELVERIKGSLAPELQWMAQQLADANWAVQQATLAPIVQRQAAERKQSLEQAYDDAATEMATKYPGWEEQEQEMNGVLEWLQGGSMTHKKYGNRLEALYKLTELLNGNSGLMRAEGLRATARAAQSRTVTGQAGRTATENYRDKIRQAKTPREAFALAAKAAEEQMRKQGVASE